MLTRSQTVLTFIRYIFCETLKVTYLEGMQNKEDRKN